MTIYCFLHGLRTFLTSVFGDVQFLRKLVSFCLLRFKVNHIYTYEKCFFKRGVQMCNTNCKQMTRDKITTCYIFHDIAVIISAITLI